ncbi:MAG TPA: HD-GYP domain-containing protein [Gammaproteobacteria bacterium]|nr:HD-GYP domain-containing protein [Gammaproteobacteria bacterium]
MRYKVNVGDLQHGMYVIELDRPWVGTPFMFQGFLIETDEELEQLKSLCTFVVVDDSQSIIAVGSAGKPVDNHVALAKANDAAKLSTQPAGRSPNAHTSVRENIEQILAIAKADESIDIKESQVIVTRLVQQSVNHNLMMQMSNLRNRQDREAGHSLNTAILAIAFGKHLGQSEERLHSLGLGAILHDIGKTRIPHELLNKPGKLNNEEFAVIKRHPNEGYEMLMASNNVPDEVLNMVRHHHERVDGSGYPNGLKGNDVPLSVGIVSLADAFETLTTDNLYQPALTPVQALQRLRTTGTECFGKDLLQDFMRFMGLYPIGSVVKLSSGDIAVVFSADPKTRMRPLIMLVRDEKSIEIRPHRLVNLAVLPESKLSITDIVDPKKYSIDTAVLFEKELAG